MRHATDGRASMGPRPNGRGKYRLLLPCKAPLKASMGPRPNGRGKLRPVGITVIGFVASMGPRPNGRGKSSGIGVSSPRAGVNGATAKRPRKVHDTLHLHVHIKRQWGRGQTAAERVPKDIEAIQIAVRQWGRGQTAAESRRHHRCTARRLVRVNGAAAKRPRKGAGAYGRRRPARRQWGRGQTAAESPTRMRRRAWCSGVNGAAAKRPRKATTSFSFGHPFERQWGRGQTAAESG